MTSSSRTIAFVALAGGITAALTVLLATWAEAAPSSGKAALVGALGVILGLMVLTVFKAPLSPLSPYAIYAYSHTAIFVLRPAYNATSQGGLNVFTLADTGRPMVTAGLLGALGFFCVSLGYAFVARSEQVDHRDVVVKERRSFARHDWRNIDPSRERAAIWLSCLTFVAGLVLYSGYIRHVGGFNNFIALNSGRSAELTQALATSSGYEISGLLLTTGTSLFLLTLGLIRRRPFLVLTATIFLLIAETPQLMTGSRSMFVPIAVAVLIIVFTTRPRLITWPRAIIAGIPAFVLLFVAPRILRSEVSATNTVTDALQQSFSYEGIMGGFFGSFDTAMIDAFALQIGAQASGQLELAGGSTYLAALGSAVPRGLWPNKPLAVDTVLNQTLFPETAAKNIGFSFGIYSEPFFNWGTLGVVLVTILFGLALGKAGALLRSSTSIVAFVSIAMASGQVFTLVRGSISFDLQRLLIPLVPLLVVWVVSAVFASDAGKYATARRSNRHTLENANR